MRDITSNEWVNLLAASHAADWDQDKDPRARKMTMQPDGSILVTGYTYYGRDFAVARIHARVRKTGGQNLVLALRVSAAGQYAAWSNGDTSFGIGVNREGRWTELAGGVSKPYTGLAEVEFSAVGQELTLRVGGDVVVKVNDASFARGRAGIGALGQGQMADLRLRVLDGLKIPPPTTQP